MATKKVEVEVDVQSNTKGAIQELKDLRRALRDAAAGSKEFDEISAKIRDVEDSIKGAKLQAEDFKGALEAAPGPVGVLARGVKSLEIATKSWGAALRATGVGLLVTTVGLLVNAFSKSEDAMKKLKPLFEGIERLSNAVFRALEPVIDLFLDLAIRAIPFVTTAFSGLFAAFDGLITFVKSSIMDFGTIASGVGNILLGIFTLDVDRIKKGLNDATTAYRNAGRAIVGTYQRTQAGSKELTQSERKEAADRTAARQKEADDAKRIAEEQAREQARIRAQSKADAEKLIEELETSLLPPLDRKLKEANDALKANFITLYKGIVDESKAPAGVIDSLASKYNNLVRQIYAAPAGSEERSTLLDNLEDVQQALMGVASASGASIKEINKFLEDINTLNVTYAQSINAIYQEEIEQFYRFEKNTNEEREKQRLQSIENQARYIRELYWSLNQGHITQKEFEAEFTKLSKEGLEEREKLVREMNEQEIKEAEENKNRYLATLTDMYNKGLIGEEEYNAKSKEITEFYEVKKLEFEVEIAREANKGLNERLQIDREARNADFQLRKEELLAYAEFARSVELGLNDWSESLKNKAEAAEGKRRDRLRKTYKTVALAELAIGSAGAIFDIWTKYAQERAGINLKYALLPGGALNPLAVLEKRIALVRAIAGTTLVGVQTGIATAKIRSEKLGGGSAAGVGGGDGGGGSALFAGAQRGIPSIAAPQINTGTGINPTQQLADTLSGITNKPIRAYVVSSDISSQQALDRRINRAGTFS